MRKITLIPGRTRTSLSDHFPPGSRRPLRRKRSARPSLEALEGRALLSTFTVTDNSDSPTDHGSLRYAINHASSGETINFASKLKGGQTITLVNGELAINTNLDIKGPGANSLTISGNNASRVFEIGSGAAVILANLTIANGLTSATGVVGGQLGGGGILNDAGANLNLTSCSLVNNKAVAGGAGLDVFGGGLLNLGVANVTSSTFTGNQALGGGNPNTDFAGSVGGGIDNFGGATLNVTGSTFTSNQAIGAAGFLGVGGAIENDAGEDFESNPSTAVINNSTFVNNLAFGYNAANGGALVNEGVGATMTVTNASLIGNRSVGGPGGDGEHTLSQGLGGGMMNELGSTLNVSNTAFVGNQALGGDGATPTLDNPLTGGGVGGAIENLGALNFLPGGNPAAVLNIDNCSFIGNLAHGGISAAGLGGSGVGGGIENSIFGAILNVTNSTFIGNQAIAGAGARGATVAPTGVGVGGGIDDSFSSTATISNSTFIGNQAIGSTGASGAKGGDGWGGGIAVGLNVFLGFADDSTLILTNSTVSGNLASGGNGGAGANGGDGFGGGVWFGMPTSPAPSNILDDSVISGNVAQGGLAGAGGTAGQGVGGGVYVTSGAVVLLPPSTKVKGNHASTSHDNVGP